MVNWETFASYLKNKTTTKNCMPSKLLSVYLFSLIEVHSYVLKLFFRCQNYTLVIPWRRPAPLLLINIMIS